MTTQPMATRVADPMPDAVPAAAGVQTSEPEPDEVLEAAAADEPEPTPPAPTVDELDATFRTWTQRRLAIADRSREVDAELSAVAAELTDRRRAAILEDAVDPEIAQLQRRLHELRDEADELAERLGLAHAEEARAQAAAQAGHAAAALEAQAAEAAKLLELAEASDVAIDKGIRSLLQVLDARWTLTRRAAAVTEAVDRLRSDAERAGQPLPVVRVPNLSPVAYEPRRIPAFGDRTLPRHYGVPEL